MWMSSCPPHSDEISAPEIELDPPAARLGPGLGKALQGVVVGQGETRDPGLGHPPDEGCGRIEPVGSGGMTVKIESHGRAV